MSSLRQQHISQARSALMRARTHCQNLRDNPAYRELASHFAALEAASLEERKGLLESYKAKLGRRHLKVVRQFMRSLHEWTDAEKRYCEATGSVAVEPPPVVSPVYPTVAALALSDSELEEFSGQRGCAHWEHEDGERCGLPVVTRDNGRPSPYCENHLGACKDPRCPSGPNYRIPIRYDFCPRCRDRTARRAR